jgi:hypothetical protein
MSKQIIVKVDAAGRVNVDAMGFTGGSCKTFTDALSNALGGGKISNECLKPEYYEQEEQHLSA